jgi:nitrite reductase (NADH) small subunit
MSEFLIEKPVQDLRNESADWYPLCRLEDLEPAWGEAALVAGSQVALFKLSDSEVYAVQNRDPATGAEVLARGIVGSRGERPTIASPLYKEVYDLETGECFTNPDLALETYPVRIADGFISIGK